MGLNNPLPSNLDSECRKCARILEAFVDSRQFGPDKIIPPQVLAGAKGLAIFTVVKVGFLGSVRTGSGLVIARTDGSWSAPSAITINGAGFGGQLGVELTDFVMILNDASAVKTFAQPGGITLGGNVSIAAGPIGRNAEASGAASLKSVAGIFSYSKTKGAFAGVSLEGSVIWERKDANKRFYGSAVSASQLLSGSVQPPPAAQPLISVLRRGVFSGNRVGMGGDQIMDGQDDYAARRQSEIPRGFQRDDDFATQGRARASTMTELSATPRGYDSFGRFSSSNYESAPASPVSPSSPLSPRASTARGPPPGRPTAPKPKFKPAVPKPTQAIALYTFQPAQAGDLGFKKGDVITITKRSDSQNDWWTGTLNGEEGIFPGNYVEIL
ncbi:hypothetical protein BZA77DRAFT_300697 [Pyronema omphalodes]|nr:hypothetical protein BZA77DRAFT_300697 [Pyronema omphalodes]